MSLSCTTCTPEDIHYIVQHTWERGKKEAALCGFPSSDAYAKHLESMAKEYGYVLREGNEPFSVFGATSGNKVYYTFFAATDKFVEHGKAATRFLYKFLRARIAEHPGVRLELGSLCDHPQAKAWFELLGFRLLKQNGLLGHYVYERD